jgi:hypothetical protein
MEAGGMSPRMDEVDNVWNKLSRAMQEQLPRVAMHGLEKSARDPELKLLCNIRVYLN